MRLMRVGNAGSERPVASVDGEWRDVSAHVSDYDSSFFQGGGIDHLRALLIERQHELPMADVKGERIGPCIARPHQILCIGLNYADHAEESGMELPSEPVLFNKAPNTLVGPNDDVLLPRGSDAADWEVELGVVIGRRARYLSSDAEGLSHVAGFCMSNDISERDFQLRRGGQWVKGKSCETFNPCGPWLVTKDQVDHDSLSMQLSVNGQLMQDGSTSTMVFGVGEVVRYVSQFMVLEPGDLINTGTPPGVAMGQDHPAYLRRGDIMELTIEGLGRQRQRCISA